MANEWDQFKRQPAGGAVAAPAQDWSQFKRQAPAPQRVRQTFDDGLYPGTYEGAPESFQLFNRQGGRPEEAGLSQIRRGDAEANLRLGIPFTDLGVDIPGTKGLVSESALEGAVAIAPEIAGNVAGSSLGPAGMAAGGIAGRTASELALAGVNRVGSRDSEAEPLGYGEAARRGLTEGTKNAAINLATLGAGKAASVGLQRAAPLVRGLGTPAAELAAMGLGTAAAQGGAPTPDELALGAAGAFVPRALSAGAQKLRGLRSSKPGATKRRVVLPDENAPLGPQAASEALDETQVLGPQDAGYAETRRPTPSGGVDLPEEAGLTRKDLELRYLAREKLLREGRAEPAAFSGPGVTPQKIALKANRLEAGLTQLPEPSFSSTQARGLGNLEDYTPEQQIALARRGIAPPRGFDPARRMEPKPNAAHTQDVESFYPRRPAGEGPEPARSVGEELRALQPEEIPPGSMLGEGFPGREKQMATPLRGGAPSEPPEFTVRKVDADGTEWTVAHAFGDEARHAGVKDPKKGFYVYKRAPGGQWELQKDLGQFPNEGEALRRGLRPAVGYKPERAAARERLPGSMETEAALKSGEAFAAKVRDAAGAEVSEGAIKGRMTEGEFAPANQRAQEAYDAAIRAKIAKPASKPKKRVKLAEEKPKLEAQGPDETFKSFEGPRARPVDAEGKPLLGVDRMIFETRQKLSAAEQKASAFRMSSHPREKYSGEFLEKNSIPELRRTLDELEAAKARGGEERRQLNQPPPGDIERRATAERLAYRGSSEPASQELAERALRERMAYRPGGEPPPAEAPSPKEGTFASLERRRAERPPMGRTPEERARLEQEAAGGRGAGKPPGKPPAPPAGEPERPGEEGFTPGHKRALRLLRATEKSLDVTAEGKPISERPKPREFRKLLRDADSFRIRTLKNPENTAGKGLLGPGRSSGEAQGAPREFHGTTRLPPDLTDADFRASPEWSRNKIERDIENNILTIWERDAAGNYLKGGKGPKGYHAKDVHLDEITELELPGAETQYFREGASAAQADAPPESAKADQPQEPSLVVRRRSKAAEKSEDRKILDRARGTPQSAKDKRRQDELIRQLEGEGLPEPPRVRPAAQAGPGLLEPREPEGYLYAKKGNVQKKGDIGGRVAGRYGQEPRSVSEERVKVAEGESTKRLTEEELRARGAQQERPKLRKRVVEPPEGREPPTEEPGESFKGVRAPLKIRRSARYQAGQIVRKVGQALQIPAKALDATLGSLRGSPEAKGQIQATRELARVAIRGGLAYRRPFTAGGIVLGGKIGEKVEDFGAYLMRTAADPRRSAAARRAAKEALKIPKSQAAATSAAVALIRQDEEREKKPKRKLGR